MRLGGLAKGQCCNWTNSTCIGAGFNLLPSGELHHFMMAQDGEELEGQPCQVGQGKRCDFFERHVLPVAESPGGIAARKAYVSKFPVDRFAGKERHCQCGEPIGKGRRMCGGCRAKRRRETYRRNRAGQERPAQQLTENALPQGVA